MEWTYVTYTIANYGISIGLVLIAIIGVFATFFSSKKGEEFVIERVIGVNPTKAHSDYNQQNGTQDNVNKGFLDTNGNPPDLSQQSIPVNQKSIFYIGIICCLLGGLTLSITAVLIFQGCFLTSARIAPGDDCPDYPMDCFIFEQSALVPITNNVSFYCESSDKADFSTNASDATAWCFGWIIRLQTTESFLDKLGVAIALIGFFTTMLAVIVYLGKCKKTVALSIMFISSCGGTMIILLVYKWSFAPLTYAILALGVGLGIFGFILFCILPTPGKVNPSDQVLIANLNQPNGVNNAALSYPKRRGPTKTSSPYGMTPYRTSKVNPT
jgi:hypothetical protein